MSVIKVKREERKLSVIGLAEKLGVTRQTIYNWEDYSNEPNITQLIKLSTVLKVAVSKIIKDYGNHYIK